MNVASKEWCAARAALFSQLVEKRLTHWRNSPPALPARAALRSSLSFSLALSQIDLADPAMRAEYGRILDRNAELGVTHAVFAPTNTRLALGDLFVNENTLLDVGWENVLWFGAGQ